MAEKTFQVNDFVWAKMRGYPAWPAKVTKHPKGVQGPSNRLYVFFYGTHQYAWMSPADLFPYTEYKKAFHKPCSKRGYSEAIWEIEEDPCLKITSAAKSPKRKNPGKKPPPAVKSLSPKPLKHTRKRKTPTSPETHTPTAIKRERIDASVSANTVASENPLTQQTSPAETQAPILESKKTEHKYSTRRKNASDGRGIVQELKQNYSARKEQPPLGLPTGGNPPVMKGLSPPIATTVPTLRGKSLTPTSPSEIKTPPTKSRTTKSVRNTKTTSVKPPSSSNTRVTRRSARFQNSHESTDNNSETVAVKAEPDVRELEEQTNSVPPLGSNQLVSEINSTDQGQNDSATPSDKQSNPNDVITSKDWDNLEPNGSISSRTRQRGQSAQLISKQLNPKKIVTKKCQSPSQNSESQTKKDIPTLASADLATAMGTSCTIDISSNPDTTHPQICESLSTDALESTANVLESTADVLKSTTDTLESTANVLESTADVLESTNDALESTTDTLEFTLESTADVLKSTTDVLESPSDALESTSDTLESTTDLLDSTTDVLESTTTNEQTLISADSLYNETLTDSIQSTPTPVTHSAIQDISGEPMITDNESNPLQTVAVGLKDIEETSVSEKKNSNFETLSVIDVADQEIDQDGGLNMTKAVTTKESIGPSSPKSCDIPTDTTSQLAHEMEVEALTLVSSLANDLVTCSSSATYSNISEQVRAQTEVKGQTDIEDRGNIEGQQDNTPQVIEEVVKDNTDKVVKGNSKVSPKSLRPKRRIKNATTVSEDSPLKKFKVSAPLGKGQVGKGSSNKKANTDTNPKNTQMETDATSVSGKESSNEKANTDPMHNGSGKGSWNKKASNDTNNSQTNTNQPIDTVQDAGTKEVMSSKEDKEREDGVIMASTLLELPPLITPQAGMTAVQLLQTHNYNLKASLTTEAPNVEQALEVLKKLNNCHCTAADVDKVPDIVVTIKKLQRYFASPQVVERANEVFQKLRKTFLHPAPPKQSQKIKTASRVPKKAPIMADYIRVQNSLANKSKAGVTDTITKNKPSSRQLKSFNTPLVPDKPTQPVNPVKPQQTHSGVENQDSENKIGTLPTTQSTLSSANGGSERVNYQIMCTESSASDGEVDKNDQMVPT